ncbi:hypothetical protein Tco_0771718 [Tanacetum coccineum]|uniref:Uncharacterized protein n=1 Tax=Tanacetum coccineum TaxID=301880 RepID=A0ABQ4ZJF5_9ASTR
MPFVTIFTSKDIWPSGHQMVSPLNPVMGLNDHWPFVPSSSPRVGKDNVVPERKLWVPLLGYFFHGLGSSGMASGLSFPVVSPFLGAFGLSFCFSSLMNCDNLPALIHGILSALSTACIIRTVWPRSRMGITQYLLGSLLSTGVYHCSGAYRDFPFYKAEKCLSGLVASLTRVLSYARMNDISGNFALVKKTYPEFINAFRQSNTRPGLLFGLNALSWSSSPDPDFVVCFDWLGILVLGKSSEHTLFLPAVGVTGEGDRFCLEVFVSSMCRLGEGLLGFLKLYLGTNFSPSVSTTDVGIVAVC